MKVLFGTTLDFEGWQDKGRDSNGPIEPMLIVLPSGSTGICHAIAPQPQSPIQPPNRLTLQCFNQQRPCKSPETSPVLINTHYI